MTDKEKKAIDQDLEIDEEQEDEVSGGVLYARAPAYRVEAAPPPPTGL